MSTWIAPTANLSDVQATVTASTTVNGDTVLIPNGTVTWNGGVSTTKQIIIRAQNYTGTFQGPGASPATRNVIITNNSPEGTPLFGFTSGNTAFCGVGGIRFNEGSGNGAHIALTGTGTKVPLVFDCYLENKFRFSGPSGGPIPAMDVTCTGGILWNCYWNGTGSLTSVGEGLTHFALPASGWLTPSTMGTLDVGGTRNFYIEDSTYKNAGELDLDNDARVVCRHTNFDGSWAETHGFTSSSEDVNTPGGGRWFEAYNCTFQVLTNGKNLANRYFWFRGGSGLFTDNVVNDANDTSSFGHINFVNVGDRVTPNNTTYPINRQPGGGHNSTSYVIDPIYLWNNTGSRSTTFTLNTADDTGFVWATVVQQNRDYFIENGAKPGFTKFPYPHPLRPDSGGGDITPPAVPTGLRIA